MDFYQILDVNKDATQSEIKKAYHKLAKKYHPDKNTDPCASEIFKKIQIAYETLSNQKKKYEYDSFDDMDNSNELKEFFMMYQQLINEVCDKYDISEQDREEINNLFDSKEFSTELKKGSDFGLLYRKMQERLWLHLMSSAKNKIETDYPYVGYTIKLISKWLTS